MRRAWASLLLLPLAAGLRVPAMSRRQVATTAASSILLPQLPALAADKKPLVKDIVKQIDKETPKEERNADPALRDEFFPVINFEGSSAQGKKVVFSLKHENLAPPSFSAVQYMWIKDESSGEILTAKKFSASDPNLVITAFGSSGQKLTAASKDDKNGIWEGTFRVP